MARSQSRQLPTLLGQSTLSILFKRIYFCRLGAYWLIEKEKSLQLYFAKDKELELVLQDVVESSWKEDHWKVLKKQLEKSDSKSTSCLRSYKRVCLDYEKYLQMREEGFKKARGGRKKQKRKIMEPNSDSNDAKKVNVETVTAT